jgi:hypothetical protein
MKKYKNEARHKKNATGKVRAQKKNLARAQSDCDATHSRDGKSVVQRPNSNPGSQFGSKGNREKRIVFIQHLLARCNKQLSSHMQTPVA